jgi:hypothetical protein
MRWLWIVELGFFIFVCLNSGNGRKLKAAASGNDDKGILCYQKKKKPQSPCSDKG